MKHNEIGDGMVSFHDTFEHETMQELNVPACLEKLCNETIYWEREFYSIVKITLQSW